MLGARGRRDGSRRDAHPSGEGAVLGVEVRRQVTVVVHPDHDAREISSTHPEPNGFGARPTGTPNRRVTDSILAWAGNCLGATVRAVFCS